MKIATWNVNSINARLPTVKEVLARVDADVWCLQEIKCEDAKFPRAELEDLGFNLAVHGQKTYNGVAILSKHPISDIAVGLPGDASDEQSRYLEATIETARPARVAAIYLPNGNPRPGEKYDYKLAFMERLVTRATDLLADEIATVLAGDYNCIPTDEDCWDINVWKDDALAFKETRARFRQLLWLGYTDAFMSADGRSHTYTFWDYQAGAWAKDHGIRIDHLLLSPEAADRLRGVDIARFARGLDKPSDHVPVTVTLAA
ncbi:exodeoxyribonuclease III [bacterium]|nr:exodeoxyribonuclease III [bacterium]